MWSFCCAGRICRVLYAHKYVPGFNSCKDFPGSSGAVLLQIMRARLIKNKMIIIIIIIGVVCSISLLR